MFLNGQQARIWDHHLTRTFPGYDKALTLPQARTRLFDDIDEVRKLRNRIAHHEPIFARNLAEDHERIRRIIECRRPDVAALLDGTRRLLPFSPADLERTEQHEFGKGDHSPSPAMGRSGSMSASPFSNPASCIASKSGRSRRVSRPNCARNPGVVT